MTHIMSDIQYMHVYHTIPYHIRKIYIPYQPILCQMNMYCIYTMPADTILCLPSLGASLFPHKLEKHAWEPCWQATNNEYSTVNKAGGWTLNQPFWEKRKTPCHHCKASISFGNVIFVLVLQFACHHGAARLKPAQTASALLWICWLAL